MSDLGGDRFFTGGFDLNGEATRQYQRRRKYVFSNAPVHGLTFTGQDMLVDAGRTCFDDTVSRNNFSGIDDH